MNQDLSWDEAITEKLNSKFGFEKFDPKKVSLSFEEKKNLFSHFVESFEKKEIKIITVAGTNGKGETARTIARELSKNGKNCGLWTSPHVLSVRERFIFKEEMISKNQFEKLLEQVPLLSFYESLFYLFCLWIDQREKVDFLILEVGLGGRLDATNFFDTDLACLTSISKDHCEILGDTHSLILKEKLGITRETAPLISCLTSDFLNSEIKEFTSKAKINWINLKESVPELRKLPYWEQNTLTALTAVNLILQGIENLKIPNKNELPPPESSPGRFEQMTLKNRGFIFIGAHNLDGLRHLVQSVFGRIKGEQEIETLFALSDRPLEEVSSMMDVILTCPRLAKKAWVCEFNHPRALSSEKLFSLFEQREKNGKENIRFAKDWAKQIQNESTGTTLVLGSYYFIGEVQKLLLSLSRTS
ncbi:MAG: hypothetical protein CME70_20165 [Halobacteriovorax sp.]|nr:hypothetical protein [Halobacteriovorax sp.]|tara:strand:- start:103744 stop:104994 length:1251 start_codon:yes stop_codon:yes gene_type:complete